MIESTSLHLPLVSRAYLSADYALINTATSPIPFNVLEGNGPMAAQTVGGISCFHFTAADDSWNVMMGGTITTTDTDIGLFYFGLCSAANIEFIPVFAMNTIWSTEAGQVHLSGSRPIPAGVWYPAAFIQNKNATLTLKRYSVGTRVSAFFKAWKD